MATLYKINKQMRESFAELLSTREDLDAARSLRDTQEIKLLKRREERLGQLLLRNAKTYAQLEQWGLE